MTIKELANLLKDSGIVGAGGAGFPSYAKLNNAADCVILNCAECEPILKLHRQVLEEYADEIVSALCTVADTIGADRAIIALKKSYDGAVSAVSSAIKGRLKAEIKFLPEIYPSGDELVTIYETTGRVVAPGKLPISVGVIVFNVETVLNIYNALHRGKPVTHKFVTIAGEVAEPKTVYAPVGMNFKELLALAGGITVSNPALINGGPMMGKTVGLYDTVTKTTNAVLVLPREHYIIKRMGENVRIDTKRAMSSCCHCRMCTDLCPRHLLGHPIEPSAFMYAASSGTIRDIKPMLNTMFCSGCGVCELYACGQGLSPRTMIMEYKAQLRKNGVAPPADAALAPVSKHRPYRGVSKERLTSRIGLLKYEKDAPLETKALSAKAVKISLSQHIGAPAVSVVKLGDRVEENRLVAKAADGALSVNIHSPISGQVTDIGGGYIRIEREDNR